MVKVQVRILFYSFYYILGKIVGSQNEPPHKKQRTSDSIEPMMPRTPSQSQTSSMVLTKKKKYKSFLYFNMFSTIDFLQKYEFYFHLAPFGSNVLDSSTFITNSHRLYSLVYGFYWYESK